MSVSKYINEHFFDVESKAMWYVLGVSVSQYSSYLQQRGQPQNRWQSTDEKLIEIVKSSLDSEHVISAITYKHIRTGKNFVVYSLNIYNQNIYDALSGRGLDVPKQERIFPGDIVPGGIEEQYLDHLDRGFFDAHVSCQNITYKSGYDKHELKRQSLSICFNIPFLLGLYEVLVEHAHVKEGKEVTKPRLQFGTCDTRAIYNFIYRDWDFIQENGLYLPSKKELFDQISTDDLLKGFGSSHHPLKISAQKRIEHAKELLLEGRSGEEISKTLKYSHSPAFYRAFKNKTGKTPHQFLKTTSNRT